MNVVGMVSAYKEGRLIRNAVNSLLRVGLDALYVYEGPAGPPLDDDVPDTDYGENLLSPRQVGPIIHVHEGRWRTDARKRDAMLQHAKRDWPGSDTWAVVIDGDEVLWNAEYLRDLIEAVHDENTFRGRTILDPDNAPVARIPLRLMEREGSLSAITGRVYRIDLIREYNISSSVITNVSGVKEGWGNVPELSPLYLEGMLRAIDKGHLLAWPPFPCEPVIVHRPHLRHPLRRGLRMSEQETVELTKAKLLEEKGR